MNKTKITALLLSVVMLAGIISGCSKSFNVTADKFVKACEKLGLEEYVDTQMQYPNLSDAENGFYIMTDDEDEIGNLTGDSFTDLLNLMDLNDDIGADDISSIAAAVKCTSLDDITGKDSLADMKFNGALALQITLKNENLAKDIIDGADDVLGIGGIMTKHLSGKEYYCSGKEGYIRLHVDIAELIKVFLNDDTAVKQFKNNFGWDPEEFFDGVKGDIAVSIDVRGANVFVLLGCALNTKPVVYEDFLKAFFLTNDPMKIPDNNKLYQDLADLLPSLLKLFIKDTGESGSCGTIPKGNGQKVEIGRQVAINYTGRLLNGKVFDTSLENVAKENEIYDSRRPYEPLSYRVGEQSLIRGWEKGIINQPAGSKLTLIIPSALGYGPQDLGIIPANSSLIFDIEIVSVK